MFRMRIGNYIGIPTSCSSIFKLEPVFALFSRLTQSWLVKSVISLTQLTSALHIRDILGLVLHGKQPWFARMMKEYKWYCGMIVSLVSFRTVFHRYWVCQAGWDEGTAPGTLVSTSCDPSFSQVQSVWPRLHNRRQTWRQAFVSYCQWCHLLLDPFVSPVKACLPTYPLIGLQKNGVGIGIRV